MRKTKKTKEPLNPLDIALLFGDSSDSLLNCARRDIGDAATEAIARRAHSDRCRAAATPERVCGFDREYVDFVIRNPPPIAGPDSAYSVTPWLGDARKRGPTIPHLSRYCLMVFGGALGISLMTNNPAVRDASVIRRVRLPNTAPIPFELIAQFEKSQYPRRNQGGND